MILWGYTLSEFITHALSSRFSGALPSGCLDHNPCAYLNGEMAAVE